MATIQSSNISGRAVAKILREQPFPHLYSDGITRMSYDVWSLCHSDNLNVWAKNSPLTKNGAKWIAPLSTSSQPYDAVTAWTYNRPTVYDANLTDFAGYTDNVIPPVSLMFPDKVVAGLNNGLSIGIVRDMPYNISYEDVFPSTNYPELYPCVCFDDQKGLFNWVAGDGVGSIDLKGYNYGNTVRVTYCLSDTVKALADPNIAAKFYSLNFSGDFASQKVLPFEAGTVIDPNNPFNVTLTIASLYYPKGQTCTFKTTDGLLGVRFEIFDSSNNPIVRDFFDYQIEEQGGNMVQGRANWDEIEQRYVDRLPPTLISAFASLRPLNLIALSNGALYVKKMMPMGFDLEQ